MLNAALIPTASALVVASLSVSVSPYGAQAQANKTATPIEHVIVVVGQNHTFDNGGTDGTSEWAHSKRSSKAVRRSEFHYLA